MTGKNGVLCFCKHETLHLSSRERRCFWSEEVTSQKQSLEEVTLRVKKHLEYVTSDGCGNLEVIKSLRNTKEHQQTRETGVHVRSE